jgi:spermidine/putrescine transport system permease protein
VTPPLRAAGRRRDLGPRHPAWLAIPAAALYVLVFAGPLALLAVFSVARQGTQFGQIVYALDFSQYAAIVDRLYVDIFLRTVGMALLGTIGVVVVGFPVAYWLARSVRRYRSLVLLLVVVPFLTSFLIRTYSWFVILDPQSWFARTLGVGDWLYSWKAIAIGLVYDYLPLFILPVYATLERMDWSLVDAAADLGGTPFRAFRQITLPLTLPGVITGTLLVFIPMCGEYVIPNLLGGGTHPFIGAVIGDQFLSAQNYPLGAALAIALMAVLTVFVVIYASLAMREEQFGA